MKTDKTKPAGGLTANQNEDLDKNLHEMFLEELADILDAEKQLTSALPSMAEAASSEELRAALESHLDETKQHVIRLEQVFKSVNAPVKSKTCKAMKGLVEEAEDMMEEYEGSPALDAGLIAAVQKMEHYEIAAYGTVCAWAEQMEHTDAVDLLERSLAEEKEADESLTEIALSVANQDGEDFEDEEHPAGSNR